MKMSQLNRIGLSIALLAHCAITHAASLSITEFAAFLTAAELDPDPRDSSYNSLQETGIGSGYNEFESANLEVEFQNGLDADGFGEVSYSLTNRNTFALETFWFFGYLDADVGVPFFNEYGELIAVDGSGANDPRPDSWEIAEPYGAGGLLDKLLIGTLSDNNAVPLGSEDDVGLALGFEIAGLGVGDKLNASFVISENDIGGLRQVSASNGDGFSMNGSVSVVPANARPIPTPSPWGLILLSLALAAMANVKFATLARLFGHRMLPAERH
ncbi:MAG TPA: IPTL-CTERM sorting domain-containing protein [Chromatiaceae bacterium]|jgi:hypothetical protein|nr:MAG: hypothetical protein N838_15950 [Thiohalocapsa sp. PB-PSB1]QQO52330.1 MAG: IPTL-CTERM sorting domain-containing protein [Thiohalocapsa sp. PB-PSB1]HBG95941.1 IPTL-CTERM sorting domain-containing protein [Chromatiaceae bacterium]